MFRPGGPYTVAHYYSPPGIAYYDTPNYSGNNPITHYPYHPVHSQNEEKYIAPPFETAPVSYNGDPVVPDNENTL